MTTREVAEYLRIKERKVYDLVREKRIPCTRPAGKWLFPKDLIDKWLAQGGDTPGIAQGTLKPAPAVCAGSHDPLLEWAIRESDCELATMPGGSLDGLERLAAGDAMVAGMHVLDSGNGAYNQPAVEEACRGQGVVLIEWAWREQGLVLAPGNPLKLASIKDLAAKKACVIPRQLEAGSQILLEHLLAEAGLKMADLDVIEPPARSETDLGLAVQDGKADAGLAVQSVAHQYRLDFLPLHKERYDLLVRRRDYFEAPVQKLMAFTATDAFKDRAKDMAGYDISGLGRVVYNAP
ncbi:MAG: helix-turn-helix transcriptional regulator [Rhodospirillales bacterium]|nr:helix-turn-helix transcriptional regulator [Rhodospirillales bacterium]